MDVFNPGGLGVRNEGSGLILTKLKLLGWEEELAKETEQLKNYDKIDRTWSWRPR